MQILQLGKKSGKKDLTIDTSMTLLYGRNGMEVWDEKRYAKEKDNMRDLFLNDPEVREFISWVRTLKAHY